MVNQNHPPQMGDTNNRVRRNVNEVNKGRRGRGGFGRGGRGGRGGRRGRGQRTRTDSKTITLTDGSQIEYHASFSFPRHVYHKFKQEDKDMLRRERETYHNNNKNRRSDVQSVNTNSNDAPIDDVSVSQRTHHSQITTDNSIMGGRNEQATNRQNRKNISAVSTKRHISATSLKQWTDPKPNTKANNECDSNADTCCLGKKFIVLSPTYCTADVYAYDTSLASIENVPIVTGATTYDDPVSGNIFILVFNKSLYYGHHLDHSLFNSNQIRSYGIPLWDNPYDNLRPLSIDVHSGLRIPLHASGTKVLFSTQVPTPDELLTCKHIQMTCPHPWNPSKIVMVQGMVQGGITNIERPQTPYSSSDEVVLGTIDPSLVHVSALLCNEYNRGTVQEVDIRFDHQDIPARHAFVSDERHVKVAADLIAERFDIGPKRAQRTLRVTTQRGIRSAILPISRRYRANRVFDVLHMAKFVPLEAILVLSCIPTSVDLRLHTQFNALTETTLVTL